MIGLNEAELVKIRQALEKNSLVEAFYSLETTLDELGFKRTGKTLRDDKYTDITKSHVRVLTKV
jgi:hypothetical protein